MFEQLKQQYLAGFSAKILLLQSALDEKDYKTLNHLVHQLAGSSGSYGLDQISALCSEIESSELNIEPNEAWVSLQTLQLIKLMQAHIEHTQ